QIRDLTMKSIAPAPIYEEGDLIKRSIRDLYNKDIDEVLVEGGEGYRAAKDFMKMIMPSHAKNVKNYAEGLPLFARYQVESYLAGMFNPTVQLKSGGYIVIGVTEALVAVDVNSGRATKEGSIEETALKTNLEAADEVARQLRLRDLAGLIVIDFIDMEERKNNASVEKRLKERLKTDRARIQVGRISGFGLLEMSRQRLRPGMLESTTQPCAHCHGTGIIRSDDSLALQILRQLEEEGTRKRSREVLLKAPVAVVNFLMNQKREHVAQIEARYGLSVRIEAEPSLISPDYVIEKFKTATRFVPEVQATVVSVDATLMPEIEDEEIEDELDEAEDEEETSAVATPQAAEGEPGRKKKRRRRRRRKGGNGEGRAGEADPSGATESEADSPAGSQDDAASDAEAQDAAVEATEAAAKPKARRGRSRKSAKAEVTDAPAEPAGEAAAGEADAGAPAETADAASEVPAKPKRTRKPRAAKADATAPEATAEATAEVPAEPAAEVPAEAPKPARARKPRSKAAKAAEVAPATEAAPEAASETAPEAASEAAPEVVQPEPAPVEQPAMETAEAGSGLQPDPAEAEAAGSDPDKPRRRG
ncbi:MAG: ribonuclease E/G, partial [Rhodobacteraceae bacterium]|nr:ribonuclease E/G [Paracoccaceae bacterium]